MAEYFLQIYSIKAKNEENWLMLDRDLPPSNEISKRLGPKTEM